MKKHALKFTLEPLEGDYRGFRLVAANERGCVNILKEPSWRYGIKRQRVDFVAFRVNYLGKTEDVGSGVHMAKSLSGAKEFCRELLKPL